MICRMSEDQAQKAQRFLAAHVRGAPLLMPNPWDAGSARLLASLGFEALATTSSGFAATLGRHDGSVTRDEAIAHAAAIVAATPLPVSADLENGFADDPDGVAQTVRLAIDAGLAGCSIEDFGGDEAAPIYDFDLAVARVAAAAAAAHDGPGRLVLTARAENHIHGRLRPASRQASGCDDLADTIARLQAYEQAGADVLYAPGLRALDEIAAVLAAVERPLNVLALPDMPSVAELAAAGVARISTGGALAFVAIGAVVEAARELREQGTYGYWQLSRAGSAAARPAFED
jgi:2-methylisocitrate lyase-like PEP mutase family enzyme